MAPDHAEGGTAAIRPRDGNEATSGIQASVPSPIQPGAANPFPTRATKRCCGNCVHLELGDVCRRDGREKDPALDLCFGFEREAYE